MVDTARGRGVRLLLIGCAIALAAAVALTLLVRSRDRPVPKSADAAATEPCASAGSIHEQAMAPLRDLLLVPGERVDLDDLPPAATARLAEFYRWQSGRLAQDWPNLCKYQQENAAVLRTGVRPHTVLIGDSITEFWRHADPALFGAAMLNRGISGQTTPQILLRFYQDVVAMRPRVVHILAGTNDITANTGPVSDDSIVNNIRAMIDIANANGIKVVLASITPADARDRNRPAERIVRLNQRLQRLAASRGAVYLDYYAHLTDGRGNIDPAFANDMLHPNRNGYAVMRGLAEQAIRQADR